jgi:mRNA (guanine-N7-)-methyltransferase
MVSPIFYLRNWNNWVKSMLIADYCPKSSCVLDLCGGKGGDFKKWSVQSVRHVVLADIAKQSVSDAFSRYREAKAFRFTATFLAGDCCSVCSLFRCVLDSLFACSKDWLLRCLQALHSIL